MEEKRQQFVMMPYDIVFNDNLTQTDIRLFAAIAKHLSSNKRTKQLNFEVPVFPGHTTLKKLTGIKSINTLTESLYVLQYYGFIKIVDRSSERLSNLYYVSWTGINSTVDRKTALSLRTKKAKNIPYSKRKQQSDVQFLNLPTSIIEPPSSNNEPTIVQNLNLPSSKNVTGTISKELHPKKLEPFIYKPSALIANAINANLKTCDTDTEKIPCQIFPRTKNLVCDFPEPIEKDFTVKKEEVETTSHSTAKNEVPSVLSDTYQFSRAPILNKFGKDCSYGELYEIDRSITASDFLSGKYKEVMF